MIPINISTGFAEIEKCILEFLCDLKESQIAKTTLQKKNKYGLTVPGFKSFYKATVIKAPWSWHKGRHIDQWNKREPQNNPSCISSNNFQQKCHSIGENSLLWISTYKIMKFHSLLASYTKINSKWIDLKVRAKTLKLLEKTG